MILFPAVDIQDGKAVRLRRGKKEEATIYAEDPVELALRWRDEGAQWLHVIDLDGAFAGDSRSLGIIRRIAEAVNLPIQAGGGIRGLDDASRCLDAGATRLIIGTTALEKPAEFAAMCRAYPGRIGVSLDGEAGKLKIRGWVRDSELTLPQALPGLEDAGAAFIIYTDIERDGTRTGANLAALADLLARTSLPVIAAGGIATLADIRAVAALAGHGNLEGVISGRALCEGSLNLAEAVSWLAGQKRQ